jgi:hypothetical protein
MVNALVQIENARGLQKEMKDRMINNVRSIVTKLYISFSVYRCRRKHVVYDDG